MLKVLQFLSTVTHASHRRQSWDGPFLSGAISFRPPRRKRGNGILNCTSALRPFLALQGGGQALYDSSRPAGTIPRPTSYRGPLSSPLIRSPPRPAPLRPPAASHPPVYTTLPRPHRHTPPPRACFRRRSVIILPPTLHRSPKST